MPALRYISLCAHAQVIHLVDEKGTNSAFMGRHASMATATALRDLGPHKKKDELALKVQNLMYFEVL